MSSFNCRQSCVQADGDDADDQRTEREERIETPQIPVRQDDGQCVSIKISDNNVLRSVTDLFQSNNTETLGQKKVLLKLRKMPNTLSDHGSLSSDVTDLSRRETSPSCQELPIDRRLIDELAQAVAKSMKCESNSNIKHIDDNHSESMARKRHQSCDNLHERVEPPSSSLSTSYKNDTLYFHDLRNYENVYSTEIARSGTTAVVDTSSDSIKFGGMKNATNYCYFAASTPETSSFSSTMKDNCRSDALNEEVSSSGRTNLSKIYIHRSTHDIDKCFDSTPCVKSYVNLCDLPPPAITLPDNGSCSEDDKECLFSSFPTNYSSSSGVSSNRSFSSSSTGSHSPSLNQVKADNSSGNESFDSALNSIINNNCKSSGEHTSAARSRSCDRVYKRDHIASKKSDLKNASFDSEEREELAPISPQQQKVSNEGNESSRILSDLKSNFRKWFTPITTNSNRPSRRAAIDNDEDVKSPLPHTSKMQQNVTSNRWTPRSGHSDLANNASVLMETHSNVCRECCCKTMIHDSSCCKPSGKIHNPTTSSDQITFPNPNTSYFDHHQGFVNNIKSPICQRLPSYCKWNHQSKHEIEKCICCIKNDKIQTKISRDEKCNCCYLLNKEELEDNNSSGGVDELSIVNAIKSIEGDVTTTNVRSLPNKESDQRQRHIRTTITKTVPSSKIVQMNRMSSREGGGGGVNYPCRDGVIIKKDFNCCINDPILSNNQHNGNVARLGGEDCSLMSGNLPISSSEMNANTNSVAETWRENEVEKKIRLQKQVTTTHSTGISIGGKLHNVKKRCFSKLRSRSADRLTHIQGNHQQQVIFDTDLLNNGDGSIVSLPTTHAPSLFQNKKLKNARLKIVARAKAVIDSFIDGENILHFKKGDSIEVLSMSPNRRGLWYGFINDTNLSQLVDQNNGNSAQDYDNFNCSKNIARIGYFKFTDVKLLTLFDY